MARLLSCLLLICILFTTIYIPAKAEILSDGQGYSGTLEETVVTKCPGHYEPYSYRNAPTDINDIKAGTNHKSECRIEKLDKYYSGGWLYKVHVYWKDKNYCPYQEGHQSGDSEANRYGTIIYACNINSNHKQLSVGESSWSSCEVRSDYAGHHFNHTDAYGRATCSKCGTVAQDYRGACNVQASLNLKLDWDNEVTGTFQGQKINEKATESKNRIQVDYNSDATLKFNFVSNIATYVQGYQWYKNGELVMNQPVRNGSKYSSASLSVSNIVDSGEAYQLKFYVYGFGWITTSPIYIDCAVKLNVYDVVKSDYTSRIYDKDFINNQQLGKNIGLYKITDPNYGGDGSLISPATTDTNYLKGWPENGTISTQSKTNEPYAGSGKNNTVGNYYTGYYYDSDSPAQLILKDNFFTDNNSSTKFYRYFIPIKYTVKFNSNKGTGYIDNKQIINNKTWTMNNMPFTYDRWQKLLNNQYIRRYYVTLKNTEPWNKSEQVNQGSTNTQSKYVNYTFLGWSQDRIIGIAPYFESTSTLDIDLQDEEIAGNLTAINNKIVHLNAVWKSNNISLPSTVVGSDNFKFLNWSDKAYPDNRVYNHDIENNKDDVDYIIHKGLEYKPYRNITLYAHWYKDIELTFNLNGGKYNTKTDNIVLKGTYYDYEPGYTFKIDKTKTSMQKGKYDTQVNIIDAYGVVTENGLNEVYTKSDPDGNKYRFLGWSLDKDSTKPDADLNVYNVNRTLDFNIKSNTTLYAIWEPILQSSVSIQRTLGDLTFKDGTQPLQRMGGLTAISQVPTIGTIIRPGEQGHYEFTVKGKDINIGVMFDTKITDIYTNGDSNSSWYDELNPVNQDNKDELLVLEQKHSLNRLIKVNNNINRVMRKFYIPLYLGTERSYTTSINIDKYSVNMLIQQPSFYYEYTQHKNEEIAINCIIYISQSSSSDGGNSGGTSPSDEPVINVLDELRTKLKIRLKGNT